MRISFGLALTTALAAFAHTASLSATEEEREIDIAGTSVQYKIVLPDKYDAELTWPAILVFGGGPQTMRTIDGALARNFRDFAETLGYIVIAPAAPNGELFFRGGAKIFPEFLDVIRAEFNVRNEKFHVAGPSNGGIAAFHVAAQNPDYFLSITAFPGYLWQPDTKKLEALAGVCVFAYIGENDQYQWHDEMRREVEYLDSLGTLARFMLEENQPHRLETLTGPGAARLFENFALAEEAGCQQ